MIIYQQKYVYNNNFNKKLSNLFKEKYTMKATFSVKKIDHFNYKISKPKIT